MHLQSKEIMARVHAKVKDALVQLFAPVKVCKTVAKHAENKGIVA